jgi:hypothetical protein
MAIDNPRESSSSSSSSCGRNIYIMSNVQRAVSADASLDDGRTGQSFLFFFPKLLDATIRQLSIAFRISRKIFGFLLARLETQIKKINGDSSL